MKTKQPSTTLSTRQIEVLKGFSKGETSKETAERLGISARTVETYRERSMRAMNARTSAEALTRTMQQGILNAPPRSDK